MDKFLISKCLYSNELKVDNRFIRVPYQHLIGYSSVYVLVSFVSLITIRYPL